MRTVINQGILVDPKNRIFSKLNIAIENGKISNISKYELIGDKVIDAAGLIIAPGFIDLHMHEDDYDPEKDAFKLDIFNCMLRMGVTTAIGGNCGIGPDEPDVYLDAVDRLGVPVNVGLLVPHGSLREKVGETDRYKKIGLDNIKKMRALTEKYLATGCGGISFGIRYIPGITEEELELICGAAHKEQKLVAAHIRDDAQNVIPAAVEFIEAGIKMEVPLQLSHIGSMGAFGQMGELLTLMDEYYLKGTDIAADCYPYNAFSTKLGATTYDEGFTKRYPGGYSNIEIAQGQYKGQRLTEELFRKLRKEEPELLTVAHVMKEKEVDLAMSHPNVIIASDGLLNCSQGHPRASGTFPRFINEYVKDKKLLNLYQALEKITYLPAQRIGIDKGSLDLGCDADLVIFDYEEIRDKATFAEPTLPPEGIRYVFLKGEIAVKDNKIINNNLGKSVRI